MDRLRRAAGPGPSLVAPLRPVEGSVLIVDDNPLNVLLLQEYFRMREREVARCAGTVREALAMARAEPPLAILLDLQLPDGNGLDLLAHLRADPVLRHVPVAIVSASHDEAAHEAAMALGARACWPKPLDLATLDDRLDELL
ncbi:response regulator [Aquabacterium humicola]|uniref:response regulator n=1 Tax=Aquabacterium humicola TaxID=3237377 RepID=UPI002543A5A5|nr:response regulator [Rubrivivax pictus]